MVVCLAHCGCFGCFAAFCILEQRKSNVRQTKKSLPAIAIMQISSTPLLDKHVEGIIDGLKQGGVLEDDLINLKKYNAFGDLSMANTIAT